MFKAMLTSLLSPESLAKLALEIVEKILSDKQKIARFEEILIQIRDGINSALAK